MEGKIKYDKEYDEYFRMPEQMLPPVTAYYFKPEMEQIFIGRERLIFEGDQKYTVEEATHLQDFFKYMKARKLQCAELTIPMGLRFLSSYKYDCELAYNALVNYYHWHQTELPKVLTPKCVSVLNTGFIRICGRDKYYRPILVVLPRLALTNPELSEVAEDACVFVMEYIVHFMFIPGKVENWLLIIDLDGIGITNVPTQLKKAIECFQNNYRCRLGKMIVLNASFMIRTIWIIVEGFMDSVTRSKIRMSTSCTHEELQELVQPEQLFEKYGGKLPLPEKGWPPVLPEGPPRTDFATQHLTEEEMKQSLTGNARVLPPPTLAEFARTSCKSTKKKGLIPHKSYYLKNDRIERRDSFNGVISDLPPMPVVPSPPPIDHNVSKAPLVEEKKIEEKPMAPEEVAEKVPPQAVKEDKEKPAAPATSAVDSKPVAATDVKIEVPKPAEIPPPQPEVKAKEEPILEPEAKIQENHAKAIVEKEKTNETVAAPVAGNKAECAGGVETVGSTISNGSSVNAKIQPHFNKAKEDEEKKSDKASCSCLIL